MRKLGGWLIIAALAGLLSVFQWWLSPLFVFVRSLLALTLLFTGIGLLRKGRTSVLAVVGALIASTVLSSFFVALAVIPQAERVHVEATNVVRERLQRDRYASDAFASVGHFKRRPGGPTVRSRSMFR